MRLPLHIFEAQPPIGKRITVLNLQLQSDNEINLVITGHIWPFRDRLEAFGIARGYFEDENSDGRCYYRVWKQIDVAGDGAGRFMEMLSTVFNNLALRVSLDGVPVPDTHVADFIGKLREKPSLFFTPLPEAPALRAVTGFGATFPPPE
jgi:hypothetical protein